DGSSTKLRFLAERGISPTIVFMGRQCLGISILSVLVLVYAFCSLVLPVQGEKAEFLPSVAMVALLVWSVYVSSMWIGQTVQSLAAAAVAAPLLSMALVYWLILAALQLDAPLWLLLLTASLPVGCVWLSMRRFMDGNRFGQTWIYGFVTACLIALLPAIPTGWQWSQMKVFSRSQRRQLAAEADSILKSYQFRTPVPFGWYDHTYDPSEQTADQANDWVAHVVDQPSLPPHERFSFDPADLDSGLPLTIDAYAVSQVLSSATYQRMLVEDAEQNDSSWEHFEQWVATLVVVARRLRQSPYWSDQHWADCVEIWLAQTLASQAGQRLADCPCYDDLAKLLTDAEGRYQARRRAVLVAWSVPDHPTPLGRRAELAKMAAMPDSTVRQWLLQDRRADAIVSATLELLEEGRAGRPTTSARRRLADLIIGPAMKFADGPYSDRLQVGIDSPLVLDQPDGLRPASTWCAPWEKQASDLVRKRVGVLDASESSGDSP
ncbi:MAG: hypothetical protein MI861_08140, partial [Pirellulales bacterium]|nr:hypothetical protein [Pirellulales bacterium]